jgi:succinate dehydrogenase / fumarate reductase cytochrome b subunit
MAHSSGADAANFGQYYFWIRRLHSLSGIMPLGVFLIMHLSANASVLMGTFDDNVALIHVLEHYGLLIPAEIFGIFLPLVFHVGFGLWIARTGKRNSDVYNYGPNRRYSFQRITAWIATVFIVYHIWHMHWIGASMGGGVFDPDNATASATTAMQRHWWVSVAYAIGVLSTVFHFANGTWTALITWGITVGERSQRIAGRLCFALGLALAVLGLGAVAGFSWGSPDDAAHDVQASSATHP